jgi:hypothetical protein
VPELTIQQYPVTPGLGRHLVRDPRSLAYRRAYDGQPLHPTAWEPRLPVLDQTNLIAQGIHTSQAYGDTPDVDALASCTGNAATALLSIILDKDRAYTAGLDTSSATEAQRFAIDLYAHATTLDQWHDYTWPSTDCGSSGLGIAKALRARGLIDQYGHATTAEQLCMLLQTGPVLMGISWFSAFTQTTDRDGFIDAAPGWMGSPLEGGHEVCLTALESVAFDRASGAILPEHTVLRFRNSWGSQWGDRGDGRLRMSTVISLLDQIDLIQPRLEAR